MQWECGRGGAGRDQVPGKDRWGVVGVAAAPHQGGFIPGNLQAGSCFITCEGKAVMKPEFYVSLFQTASQSLLFTFRVVANN